ncbi:MAG: elongation factor P [Bacteroidales bacterium]|jgi:elongation factor P|nr:elongation factor P [Bacteroidales bacterium]
MATTADFKNGLCIEFNGDPYVIVDFQHVKPGKGAAFVRTKLKNLKNGRTIPNTFNAGVKIDTIRVERRQYQFLYAEGDDMHFMNNETFEQTFLPAEMVEGRDLLKEGISVDIVFLAENEQPLSCELPAFVDLLITYCEPGEKGNTATNALKPATVETGAIVRVPMFVNEGETIRVDTRTGDYSERVRN